MRVPFPGRSLVLPDDSVKKKAPASHTADFYSQLVDGRQGYELLWARSLHCSCRANNQTEQPRPTCNHCGGAGWRYVHPHPELFPNDCAADGSVNAYQGERIRGLLQRMKIKQDQRERYPGQFAPGTGVLTTKAEVELGYHDRLIMVEATEFFDQVIEKTADTIEIGWSTRTQLRYPVVSIAALHTETARYRERTHFAVDREGRIVFRAGAGPSNGERFSVRYAFRPRWVVTGVPRSVIGYRQSPKQSKLPFNRYVPLPRSYEVMLDYMLFEGS